MAAISQEVTLSLLNCVVNIAQSWIHSHTARLEVDQKHIVECVHLFFFLCSPKKEDIRNQKER